MKVLFTYSHSTGGKRASKEINRAKDALKDIFGDVDSLCTLSIEDARRTWEKASSMYEVIVVGGGDGTFSAAVDTLMRRAEKPILGYWNLGTLGDAGRNLGGSLNHYENTRKPCKIGTHCVDIPNIKTDCGERYFFYSASFGTYSDVAYSADRESKKRWGRWAYYGLSMKEAFAPKAVRGRWVDERGLVHPFDAPFILCVNGEYMGGFRINRGSSLEDGSMELYAPRAHFMGGLLEFLPFKTISPQSFHKASIEIEGGDTWCVDGEKMPGRSATIEVFSKSLRIFCVLR